MTIRICNIGSTISNCQEDDDDILLSIVGENTSKNVTSKISDRQIQTPDDSEIPAGQEDMDTDYELTSIILDSNYSITDASMSYFFGQLAKDEQIGTQRVYKKTSPNSVLTLYLPTREVVSCGTNPAILKGILFVDPKLIQGYRVYAQLTLTFRYGREDEEVMGLRFCNEAIMSLHQIWPRTEEPTKESLTPLQDALMKRLGEGAHPFTLSLTPQAPPSVQLVPAKRYYGAPIGTSYDVRCFIADKTDEKFHRRASVKMGIRVIHRTDVFSSSGPENFAALVNNQSSPPSQDLATTTATTTTTSSTSSSGIAIATTSSSSILQQFNSISTTASSTITNAPPATPGIVDNSANVQHASTTKPRKSERGDSFPKIRLSPKSFRFSSRFGRSKSEAERGPSDPFYNYSKSFQEYETGGGPQGAVDKPFLLQEGRVGLRASLDKSWYTHGEDVIATVNIKNDSRKSVRRMRVCAIQHVDVCMFNNGKFKNVVADSDVSSPSGTDRIVGPGGSLNATIILKPQRGPTKNWIALEDSLQRSSEPDEITGAIAASAVRNPPVFTATGSSGGGGQPSGDDRNVFAIYVSYYVKVKLTLSGMGGELSLKLPFALVHVDSSSTKHNCGDLITSPGLKDNEVMESISKLTLTDPINRITKGVAPATYTDSNIPNNNQETSSNAVDKIESIEDDVPVTQTGSRNKRKLMRHETVVKDLSSDEEEAVEVATAGPCIIADKEVPKSRNEDVDHHQVDNNPTTSNQQTTCVQIHASSS